MYVARSAFLVLLLLVPHAGAQEKAWSERFPQVAARVPNLDKRMSAQDAEVRKRVVTILTFGRPRDRKVYPPFFRELLKDPSAEVRGIAVKQLWEHHVFLSQKELPDSFDVAFVGEFFWRRPDELVRVRKMAQFQDHIGGWAIHALGIAGDKDATHLARALLRSDNVFTRHSAAVALIQMGHVKEGIDELHKITDAKDDKTSFYRYRAAEGLFRLGERGAIEVLFDMMDRKVRDDYIDGAREIVEDLTGQYFLTGAEGRAWWKMNKE